MILHRLASLLFSCVMAVASMAQQYNPAIQLRNGLPAFLQKLKNKQPVVVVYLGGSITAAGGYRVQTTEWLQQQYPGVNLRSINAGVGGTGSSLGVFRLQYDVLRFKPDLVFVEFAVNDAGGDSLRIGRAMEGIVRQIKKANATTDVCFLYTINEPMVKQYHEKNIPGSVRYMEKIAAHYQLPSINLAYDVLRLQDKDSLVFKGKSGEQPNKILFTQDGTHPTTDGHKVYTENIKRAFGLLQTYSSKQLPLAASLFPDNFETATVYPPSRATVSGQWQPFTDHTPLKLFQGDYPQGIYTNSLQDSISFRFRGTYFGVGDVLGPSTCGKLIITIDGKPRTQARFDRYCARYRRSYFFIDNLEPGEHQVTIRIDPTPVNKKSILKPDEIGTDLTRYEPNYFYFGSLLLPADTNQQQTNTASSQKLQWWSAGKFGLFLHWGLYSVTAGDWKGHPTKGGEHFMLYERIPVKEYAGIAKNFNPVAYNADTWVRLAHEAGMRYIVITAKHHDGFAMYDSRSSHYNIVALTPYRHDPMKDLAAACKKYGVKLCFYYSLGRDWEDPDVPTNWPTKGGRSNTWDFPNEDAKDIAKYVERKVKPQLHELLTQYGPIAIIWFDTPELITAQQSAAIKELVHSLQPECIVNSRIGNGLGDYNVSEQKVPGQIIQQPWEACMTISANWGYNRHDSAWKSPEVLIRQLTDVVSKGGNLLLNVSPTGTGVFPDSSVARLRAVGRWMKVNKEAIYGTKPWRVFGEYTSKDAAGNNPASKPGQPTMLDAVNDAISKNTTPDLRFTQKGNTVYLIARSWHQATVVSHSFSGVNINSIRLLGSSKKIQWKQENDALTIQMPLNYRSEVPVYVFVIQ